MEHPTGEAAVGSLRVDFDRRLKPEFHGSRITSDAGLLAYRELDDALGLTDIAGAALSECRRGKNTRHMLTGLFRQSVFGRLAGYEDVNDADRIGARIVRHGRSVTFQMAEVMVPRDLFQQILDAIGALRPAPPTRC